MHFTVTALAVAGTVATVCNGLAMAMPPPPADAPSWYRGAYWLVNLMNKGHATNANAPGQPPAKN